jgi:M6 family metalloprotease-like protein
MATVNLTPHRRTLFVGSFTPVSVEIDPASGINFDDLRFETSGGVEVGVVSVARGPEFDPAGPEVMLLAGNRLGKHRVFAIDGNTGKQVGATAFAISDRAPKQLNDGPGFWFSSSQDASYPLASAIGGGPSGPQNTRPTPVGGTWRIALVFADTSSQRYPAAQADMDLIRNRWMDELTNGVNDNGMLRSVRRFIEEVSYNNLTISVTSHGPYQLSGAWEDYFTANGSFMGTLADAAVAAADGDVDFTKVDTIAIVTPRVPASPPTNPNPRAAWPVASIGRWGPYATQDGSVRLGIISMAEDWGTASNREIFETFSHELGHNLGLFDQYAPSVPNRNVGSWDLMDWEDPHPHLSVGHRMMLGWVRPDWVEALNFATSGAPFDRTFELEPIELGQPAGSRRSAIEVRIADGYNYYFEYRAGQASHIGDRALPMNSRVLGTDVLTDTSTAPSSRPQFLLLADHRNDDGAVLGDGQVYREIDNTTPGFPNELRVDVSGVNGSKADVRVRYGTNGRPDPSIRPWPASPDRPWQSPDIEVRNLRSQVRPEWANTPWLGQANTVVARVRNGGNVQAPDVQVDFYVKDYNVGSTPEFYLGSDTRTINAGQTVEFTTTWVPPKAGHFCIIARIPLYTVPTAPSVIEMTELNNTAQSNYDRFIPTTASPSTREVTHIAVSNPYDEPTTVFINSAQSNAVYRVLVEHRWLRLKPGETRHVPVMFEYGPTPDDDVLPADMAHLGWGQVMELTQIPNRVGLWAFAFDPRERPFHTLALTGGAQAEVQVGRRTHFEELKVEEDRVNGMLVAVDRRDPVTGGTVIVTLDAEANDDPRAYAHAVADVDDEGRFAVDFHAPWRRLWLEYVPPPGFGPATSDVFEH